MPLLILLSICVVIIVVRQICKQHISSQDIIRYNARLTVSHLYTIWSNHITTLNQSLDLGQSPKDTSLFRSSGNPDVDVISFANDDDIDSESFIRELRLDLSILMTSYIMDSNQLYDLELMDDITYGLTRLTELQKDIELT